VQWQQHFMTVSHAQKVLVSGCSHCDIINQMLQIRHIEYQECGCPFIPDSSDCSHMLNCRFPVSDINIGLILIAVVCYGKPNQNRSFTDSCIMSASVLWHYWPLCVEQLAAQHHYIAVTHLFQAATENVAVLVYITLSCLTV